MSIEKLYIFEKPDAGKHFVKALGWNNPHRNRHFIQQGNIAVTWCLGHLIQQAPPETYRPDIKKGWDVDKLPIIPEKWEMQLNDNDGGRKAQAFAIRDLLKKSESVVIATDCDREGETIGWEIIEFFNYKGKLFRMIYSELASKVLIKANNNLEDAEKYRSRYYAGLGRMRADWIMGFNLTIGYTAYNQGKLPPRTVINAGRVISPLIYLLVLRDNERRNFKPEDHYAFKADFLADSSEYSGDLILKDEWLEDKILKDVNLAKKIHLELKEEKKAQVVSNETKKSSESHPTGFSLSELQKLASKKFGFSPKQTLDIAQSLYETHQLISYPRTDCRFIGEAQFADRKDVLESIFSNIGNHIEQFKNIKKDILINQKTAIWNDKKISAHHAIIPTDERKNLVNLNQAEMNLYDVICRRYVAQFLPIHEYNQTNIITETQTYKYQFKTTGRVVLVNGWKDIEKDNESKSSDLPKLSDNEVVTVKNITKVDKKTEPPKNYTYDTLLNDMNNIDRFINNPKLKKIIKGKGIGTEATRADHIEGLFQKGYATKEKKSIIATEKAHTVVDILPDENKQPEVSAYWEEELELIEKGQSSLDDFLKKQASIINRIIKKIKNGDCAIKENIKGKGKTYSCDKCNSVVDKFKSKKGNVLWRCLNKDCDALYTDNRGKRGDLIKMVAQPEGEHPCPTCGKNMLLRKKKDKDLYFWVCSDKNCKTFCQDNNGKVGDKIVSKKQTSEHKCPKCEKGRMIQRSGTNGKFWGCNNYPECKTTLPDLNDKPDYENKNTPQKSDYKCQKCDKGYLVKRRKKSDKSIFWGCNNFPECKNIVNNGDGDKPEGY